MSIHDFTLLLYNIDYRRNLCMKSQSSSVAAKDSILRFMAGGERQTIRNEGYLTVLRVRSGETSAFLEEAYELCADDVFVIPTYTTLHLEARSDCHYLQFIFDSPRFFDEIGIPPLFRITPCIKNDRVLCGICDAVGEEYEHQSAFHETMLNALITQLVIRLYRIYPGVQYALSNDLGKQRVMRRALNYIYENCQNGISTSDIAKHTGVSGSYLCRVFKEICGSTPLDYSERIRCRKAHEDLTRGVYSVSEIAAKYHFSSLSYFNRRYRKYIGKNPSETRNEAIRRHENCEYADSISIRAPTEIKRDDDAYTVSTNE